MDINKQMIDFLSENYKISNILYGNIEEVGDYPSEEFDIVVAGEILEHLSNPGKALESINQVLTNSQLLVITVPNAYSFKGFCRAVFGYEFIHEDHVLHHSPYTLKSLLARYGFKIEQSFSFVNGGTGIASNIANFILKGMPQLAEGIGVVCSKNIK
jgi:2-polyprenyl-3-methyl-5-hydroxy-6-metoxy-1,4-benzoquinol methylase